MNINSQSYQGETNFPILNPNFNHSKTASTDLRPPAAVQSSGRVSEKKKCISHDPDRSHSIRSGMLACCTQEGRGDMLCTEQSHVWCFFKSI